MCNRLRTEFRIGLVKEGDEFVHSEYHMLHFRKAKDGLPMLTRYAREDSNLRPATSEIEGS